MAQRFQGDSPLDRSLRFQDDVRHVVAGREIFGVEARGRQALADAAEAVLVAQAENVAELVGRGVGGLAADRLHQERRQRGLAFLEGARGRFQAQHAREHRAEGRILEQFHVVEHFPQRSVGKRAVVADGVAEVDAVSATEEDAPGQIDRVGVVVADPNGGEVA